MAAAQKVFFGNLCHDYIREEGLTIVEVAEKVGGGLQASQFTRWKRGDWSVIEAPRLAALVKAVTKDSERQANLVIAYLIDLTPIEFRPMIDIGIRGGVKSGSNAAEELSGPWSKDLRQKLETIGSGYGKSQDFQRMVNTLADWGRRLAAD